MGADGSVRMFDLRSLEHSTIIYETHDLTPLMRLSWNKQDPNYLATILTDCAKTVILDIRHEQRMEVSFLFFCILFAFRISHVFSQRERER